MHSVDRGTNNAAFRVRDLGTAGGTYIRIPYGERKQLYPGKFFFPLWTIVGAQAPRIICMYFFYTLRDDGVLWQASIHGVQRIFGGPAKQGVDHPGFAVRGLQQHRARGLWGSRRYRSARAAAPQ